MKTKRIISAILCLALLLCIAPAAIAETTPVSHEQLIIEVDNVQYSFGGDMAELLK